MMDIILIPEKMQDILFSKFKERYPNIIRATAPHHLDKEEPATMSSFDIKTKFSLEIVDDLTHHVPGIDFQTEIASILAQEIIEEFGSKEPTHFYKLSGNVVFDKAMYQPTVRLKYHGKFKEE